MLFVSMKLIDFDQKFWWADKASEHIS